MLDLVITILRLFITFLNTVVDLLEARQVAQPLPTEEFPSSPSTARPTSGQPPPVTPVRRTPTRYIATPNEELRQQFAETRICTHYWHQTSTPYTNSCPICHMKRELR